MLLNALRRHTAREPTNALTVASLGASGVTLDPGAPASTALKLSAVNACIEILSNSMGKLPVYVFDGKKRERLDHALDMPLSVRPNVVMTPFVRKRMLEINRLSYGNAYEWIVRDPYSRRPVQLIPIPSQLVQVQQDKGGNLWYFFPHPYTGAQVRAAQEDICHYKAYSGNGIKGLSVLQRANEVITSARRAQQYDSNFYKNGARPDGILSVEGDLSGTVKRKKGDGSEEELSKKELIREEWEKVQGGSDNAYRTAVLDYGMKYQPIALNQSDAKFIERTELSIQDIARFFGVPLYKLMTGNQSYNANEQNRIEYGVGTLHPNITQYEEEQSFKLLTSYEQEQGLEVRINMMAELRGDSTSRANFYKTMRQYGGYTANDIRALEDLPDKEGGDELYASLNYVPMSIWEQLSLTRNAGNSSTHAEEDEDEKEGKDGDKA